MPSLSALDWSSWIRSIIAAFIGGGAGAVSNGFSNMLVAPDQFNLAHPGKLMESMAASFIVSGTITVMAYLRQSPIPQEIKTTTTTVTVEQKTVGVSNDSATTSDRP